MDFVLHLPIPSYLSHASTTSRLCYMGFNDFYLH
jgi:hypothetical protein